MKHALIALALLSLGACGQTTTASAPAIPRIQMDPDPQLNPTYSNTCAGGQPGMHYNCPSFRN